MVILIILWEQEKVGWGGRGDRSSQREAKQTSNTDIEVPNKIQTMENYKLENYFQSYFIKYLFGDLRYVSTLE